METQPIKYKAGRPKQTEQRTIEDKTKRPIGRPPKYPTEDDRLKAKRAQICASVLRHYHKTSKQKQIQRLTIKLERLKVELQQQNELEALKAKEEELREALKAERKKEIEQLKTEIRNKKENLSNAQSN